MLGSGDKEKLVSFGIADDICFEGCSRLRLKCCLECDRKLLFLDLVDQSVLGQGTIGAGAPADLLRASALEERAKVDSGSLD